MRSARFSHIRSLIRKIGDYTVLSKVTKILLVKDHARKGKESFHVKTKDSTCAAFCGRPVQLKKKMMNKKIQKIKCREGLRMLLLLHAIILCLHT